MKASKQARKDSRAARVADVKLRYRQVALPCPGAAAGELWIVHAREEHPPPTAEPPEWFVLTTLPVTSTADATQILRWYALPWRGATRVVPVPGIAHTTRDAVGPTPRFPEPAVDGACGAGVGATRRAHKHDESTT